MRTRGRIYPTAGQDTLTSYCFNPPPAKKRRTTVKLVVSGARDVRSSSQHQHHHQQQPDDDISFARSDSASTVSCSPAAAEEGPAAVAARAGCGIDKLHDDLLITILTKVSSTASSPGDLINTMLTCRRFLAAGKHPFVLLNAAPAVLTVKASRWSDGAHRFLKQCADAGNVEACYTIGMIYFYCLQTRGAGASLMAKAAMESHAAALLSLAVIQFNGSGGTRKDKDLRSGFTLCARAASLGYVDAVRELGHCLQDGYGVTRNVPEGRRLLLEANAREAAAAVAASPRAFIETALQMTTRCNVVGCQHHKNDTQSANEHQKIDLIHRALLEQIGSSSKSQLDHGSDNNQSVYKLLEGGGCFLLSDFGCTVPPAKIHIANKFLVDWFHIYPPAPGLRLCSHSNCGRPETRKHEFRRCSACGSVNYCSRACQALDWKLRHKLECSLVAAWDDWEDHEHDDEEDDVQGMDEIEES
ncbi:unnamed protein product [Calypogeia fissa]